MIEQMVRIVTEPILEVNVLTFLGTRSLHASTETSPCVSGGEIKNSGQKRYKVQ